MDFIYIIYSMRVYSSRWQHFLDMIFFLSVAFMLVSATPPHSCSMAEKGKKHFSTGVVSEAIFQDQDRHDEQFDCGSDLEMVKDSE